MTKKQIDKYVNEEAVAESYSSAEKLRQTLENSSVVDSIKTEYDPYIGTIVLQMFQIVRLVGFDFTHEDGYYYILECVDRGRFLCSCVMGLIPLKGFIREEDYTSLERWFKLNYADKMVGEFL